ncbi:MAG: hypothetical protein IKY22_09635 [Bacteroidales bacterium]|nr:hypothetical protein [Bacteroidales bacterium]
MKEKVNVSAKAQQEEQIKCNTNEKLNKETMENKVKKQDVSYEMKRKYVEEHCYVEDSLVLRDTEGGDCFFYVDEDDEICEEFVSMADKCDDVVSCLNFRQYCYNNDIETGGFRYSDGKIDINFDASEPNKKGSYVLIANREDYEAYGYECVFGTPCGNGLILIDSIPYNENMDVEEVYQNIINVIYDFEHDVERVKNVVWSDDCGIDIIAHWDWHLLTREMIEECRDRMKEQIESEGWISGASGERKSEGWYYFQGWRLDLRVLVDEINELLAE